jgi:hypothetical protein
LLRFRDVKVTDGGIGASLSGLWAFLALAVQLRLGFLPSCSFLSSWRKITSYIKDVVSDLEGKLGDIDGLTVG